MTSVIIPPLSGLISALTLALDSAITGASDDQKTIAAVQNALTGYGVTVSAATDKLKTDRAKMDALIAAMPHATPLKP